MGRYITMRFGKRQRIGVLGLALAAAVLIVGNLTEGTGVFRERTVPAAVQTVEISGADMTQRTGFLSSRGMTAHGELEDTVKIPSRFDTVYEDYNDLQKEQGFDLSRYRGKEVRRFRYPVTGAFGDGVATLLVYRDRIIGGDLSAGGERYALGAADTGG